MSKWMKGMLIAGAFFLALEVLVRVIWSPAVIPSEIDVGMQLKPHKTRIWALEPGVQTQFGVKIRIDASGFRASSLSNYEDKWLVLGDSSFFGHGLRDQDTLHEQLQTALNQQGYDIHVMCGGVPGYSVLQTQRLMDEVGWKTDPQILLIGNLWSDNNFDHFVDQEWLDALEPNFFIHTLQKSHFFLLLSHTLRPMKEQKKGDPHSKISWIKEPYQTGRRRVPLSVYATQLDRLIQAAATRGVGVLLLQPANRYRVDGSVSNATWDPYFLAQQKIAAHRNIPIFDVAAYLRVFGLSADDAFLDELHPTAKANALVAQGIVLTLQSIGWPNMLPVPNVDRPVFSEELSDSWERGVSFQSNTGQDQPPSEK